ncbi:NAD-dependent epimerase/dehydratase family protein [Flavilitoribacter nigricans]|uniref:Epimerase n=1 Tax=Flavilitoribacter nigricans (strain ATCC 23147 / DSM 23189 / NBRC 102662 / NCIMB 1420 / SS-2) TaxID=1122177 RepID=A0A2D0NH99_FLAN2|nr:NAD-dependent epimerase/dehydratase family protein [Flavilitoribacter nigricans]PHN07143.1 epimerase [Flavilitoribacter nigricans DSM 23189 = NBRC 102662]
MKKVIITGSTGMVGQGVLLECLDHPQIEKVLVVNRSTLGMEHPKLAEVLLADFMDVASVKEQLRGYDGCFYCMGVSAVGMDEQTYTHITYDTTRAFVEVLYELNPDMVFNYVSGTGTDSSEKGRLMWARVKGRTENLVLQRGFKDAYAFRPGVILPEKGIQSKTGWYNTMYSLTRPIFPWLKKLSAVTTTTKVGLAMIHTLFTPSDQKILENVDINRLAES